MQLAGPPLGISRSEEDVGRDENEKWCSQNFISKENQMECSLKYAS